MKSPSSAALVAYVATPHAGYLKLFRAHQDTILYVLGEEFIRQFPALVRHLPGVTPEESQKMIQALGIFADVRILSLTNIESVRQMKVTMPDEDVSHALAKSHFAGAEIIYDGSWRLRWDWGSSTASRRPEGERVISVEELDRDLMHYATFSIAVRSPDWWRQIGALLVKNGEVLLAAFNQHVPSEQSAYCYGDPRSNFEPGQGIDVSGALHAEMGVAAAALERGICTKGCDLYVTTFPCPPCAYPWAFSGIRRLYYKDGYSLVAGAEVLESKNVEIIRVEM